MERSDHPEPREGWGEEYVTGADWARLRAVLELARREQQRTEERVLEPPVTGLESG